MENEDGVVVDDRDAPRKRGEHCDAFVFITP
jgi:hypothetical protein